MENKIHYIFIVLILICSSLMCLAVINFSRAKSEQEIVIIERERLEVEKDYYEFQKQTIRDLKGNKF